MVANVAANMAANVAQADLRKEAQSKMSRASLSGLRFSAGKGTAR
jgi:hypothetical protein